jgi:hypothetical protein
MFTMATTAITDFERGAQLSKSKCQRRPRADSKISRAVKAL